MYQNSLCLTNCEQGYIAGESRVCYKKCTDDCCPRDQIKVGDECVDFDNQIHVVTPEGEKIHLDVCNGYQMPNGLCVTQKCDDDHVWIESGCYPVQKCDYGVWNGVCISQCLTDEYFDRRTKLCVKNCNYVNMTGNVCERPDDLVHCPIFVPSKKVEGQYICETDCFNILYQERYCFESCPSGMIEVAKGVCDIDC